MLVAVSNSIQAVILISSKILRSIVQWLWHRTVLVTQWWWVPAPIIVLLSSNLGQVVHTYSRASVIKQYKLVPVKGRWWCAVGKVNCSLVESTGSCRQGWCTWVHDWCHCGTAVCPWNHASSLALRSSLVTDYRTFYRFTFRLTCSLGIKRLSKWLYIVAETSGTF